MTRFVSVSGVAVLFLSLMAIPAQAALQVFNEDFLWDATNEIYWSRDTNLADRAMVGGDMLTWIEDLNAGVYPAENPSHHNGWRLPSYDEMAVMYNDYFPAYRNDGAYTAELEDGHGNLIIQAGDYWATPLVDAMPGYGFYSGYRFNFLKSEENPGSWGPNYGWLVTDIEPAALETSSSLPTPIPASIWLVASGFMGLVAWRRRTNQ